MPIGPEQLGLLHRAQLAGLVRARWGAAEGEAGSFPSGATLVAGSVGWVLTIDAGPRALGGALVWAAAKSVDTLHVLVDVDAPTLAREAGRFDHDITVWQVDGAELLDVEPAAVPTYDPPSEAAQVLARELEVAGLDVVVESGITSAEVLGLEVARVIEGPGESGDATVEAHLEAGVGRFDREMSALMHRDEPPLDAVLGAAVTVRTHRYPGAPRHPLRDLGAERWLRHALVSQPALIDAVHLEPIGTTVPRPNLRDAWPALAHGALAAGGSVVVAATTGIDLDALVLAADTRAEVAPEAELLVVVSPAALPPSVQAVAAWLARPARFQVVPAPWE